MNPTAIYSKTGKGVQEAAGKTSLLARGDRAVLSAIDGRATFEDLQGKFEKMGADKLQALIEKLDKDGFVREVSAGAASAAPARPAATMRPAAPAKPPPAAGGHEELDFTQAMKIQSRTAAPPPPPPPQQDLAAKARDEAERKAKEQEGLDYRKRHEAEAKAKAEAEANAKAAAEARVRAEAEARTRAEAETRARLEAESEAKVKAAREAAVRATVEAKTRADTEAKARAEAEAKLAAERKAREESERRAKEEGDRRAREAEERARKEAEEKARREQEELRRQLEEAHRAREEAERKAKEDAERRKREDEERRKREEEDRRRREEDEARRKREEEAARKKREEEEARRKREEDESRRKREEEDSRRKREDEERARRQAEAATGSVRTIEPRAPEAKAPEAKAPPAIDDSLLADLESFSQREDEERRAKEEAERKAKEEKARLAREDEERRKREEEAARRKAEEERRRREEEARRAREEEERREREEEARTRQEEAERKQRAKEAVAAKMAAQQQPAGDDIGVSEEDLDMDDVKRDEKALSAEARRRERERELEEASKGRKGPGAAPAEPRKPLKLGKPLAIGVFALLVLVIGGVHVMPISTGNYEKAASEALGQPVKIGGARLSVITGVELKLERVAIGEGTTIGLVRASVGVGSLLGEQKSFGRVELENATIAQHMLGDALLGALQGDRLRIARVVLRQAKLDGAVTLPALDGEIVIGGDGRVQGGKLTGPDKLVVELSPKGGDIAFDASAGSIAIPFVPALTLADFGMKGSATRQGMSIAEFDGRVYEGVISGTARIAWGANWTVDGTVKARGVNAAVFAPALVSEGKGEGSGTFTMSGPLPAKLGEGARLEGGFKIEKGVLGSFDLSRALQTSGGQATGRTIFTELSGQVVYDKGLVQMRGITVAAGALNAGASLDVGTDGTLVGRVIADLKTPAKMLRETLNLSGKLTEPQLRR